MYYGLRNSLFDVRMGSFDGVKICEFANFYFWNKLSVLLGKNGL